MPATPSEVMLDPQIVTRARGALLGLVAGNQLGVPTQGMGTPAAIRAAFPEGIWDPAAPPTGSPYDDDAALALLCAESLLDRGDFDAADVARRWAGWVTRDGRGVGPATRISLGFVAQGESPFEAGRRARQEEPGRGSGADCLARVIPLALRFFGNPTRLTRVAAQQAAITHADERAGAAAVALALAARELVSGNVYFIEEVRHRLRDAAPRAVLEALYRSAREAQTALPITTPPDGGWAVGTLEIAVWFATHNRSLEDALVYLAQAGGSTGTNAAVAGALLGARDGEAGFPPQWIAGVPGVKGITRLADRLIEAGFKGSD